MDAPVAIYDACVLFPFLLRDVLVRLTLLDKPPLIQAKWTETIHSEWISSLLDANPRCTREKLEQTRRRMDEAVDDCLVTGFEILIPCLSLPDMDDRHVLAAAICAKADLILTFNLKHFPRSALDPYGIAAQSPDEFIADAMHQGPEQIVEMFRELRHDLRKPPMAANQLVESLAKSNMCSTAQMLSGRLTDL